ncbi:MAG: hypothetical protein PHI12_12790, partial [Dehalococcoidales bacterium]|nr:hypothetical protein [Dehalococcoidales bacterium]
LLRCFYIYSFIIEQKNFWFNQRKQLHPHPPGGREKVIAKAKTGSNYGMRAGLADISRRPVAQK